MGAALALLVALPCAGQRPSQPPAQDFDKQPAPGVALPVDRRYTNRLAALDDYTAEKDWDSVTRLLQQLLAAPDVLVPLPGDARLVGLRGEALRRLNALPPEGLEHYRLTLGPLAKQEIGDAVKARDAARLAAIASRYPLTDASDDALLALGALSAEARHQRFAALAFRRVGRPASKWPAEAVFQAAVAFRRAGDAERAAAFEKELAARKDADLTKRLADSKAEDAVWERFAKMTEADRPLVGGDARRSAESRGGAPYFDAVWRAAGVTTDEAKGWIKQAEAQAAARKQVVVPAALPVTVTLDGGDKGRPLVVFRDLWGWNAHDAARGELLWKQYSNGSPDRMLREPGRAQALQMWLQGHQQAGDLSAALFGNSTVGTMSSDGKYVFAVDDLQVLPPILNPQFGQPQPLQAGVSDALEHNRLEAFELTTGKLRWEVGGRGEKAGALADSFFLGPPLPLEGRLYSLVERAQELRLVSLDPVSGKMLGNRVLGTVRDKITADPRRRAEAAHIAYADGLLVVPTNAGTLFGVDAITGGLSWAFAYRTRADEPAQPPMPFVRPGVVPAAPPRHWLVTPPAVVGDKVVFAAPDSRGLFCVRLRDGSLVWRVERGEDDLYFAVVGDKAVVVGKRVTRAYDLGKGEMAWALETGEPSGLGVAAGGHYYLPLRAAAASREPEVAVIDVKKGALHSHVRSRKKEVPGNLVLFGAFVISQTPTELVVYPTLKAKLDEIDERLKKAPDDPVGLAERGGLRLEQGDVAGAVADLLAARAKAPPDLLEKVEPRLFDALVELLQRDFDAGEKHLKTARELALVKDEAEARRRRVTLLLLTARGRERQGKPAEAVEAYLRLAAFGGDELIPSPDEPVVGVAPDALARSRISALLTQAVGDERQKAEATLRDRLKEATEARGIERLRELVAAVGPESATGRAARLELAERLIPEKDFVQAERLLLEARRHAASKAEAAAAVLGLARVAMHRGQPADAVFYYRLLGTEYAAEKLPGGKTGAEHWEAAQTDKRLLPFLEEPKPLGGRLKATEERGSFPAPAAPYLFAATGDRLPFYRRHALGMDLNGGQVRLVDRDSRETIGLGPAPVLTGTGNVNLAAVPPLTFTALGHLAVMPGGARVFGVDPVGRKVLWRRSLADAPAQPQMAQVTLDPVDGMPRAIYADGWVQAWGASCVATPSAVVLLGHDALFAVDPASGRTLWSRPDAPRDGRLFGDDEAVFVVEYNGDTPTATRAFRTSDGASLKAPGFADVYGKQLRRLGRRVLAAEHGARGLTLWLYDPLTGKDVWKHDFPANTRSLKSYDDDLTGALGPDGKVVVLDAHTGRKVMEAEVEAKLIANVLTAHLTADAGSVYVACQAQTDLQTVAAPPQPNVMPGMGLRSLPVNGHVFAFDRRSGKLRWYDDAPNQQLLLPPDDLPVLVLTARVSRFVGAGGARRVENANVAVVIDKRTGKYLYNAPSLPGASVFHALTVDRDAGQMELVGSQVKVTVGPAKQE
jgi:outer membrane protein assembly factor BamB